jgi:hypothetical protein
MNRINRAYAGLSELERTKRTLRTMKLDAEFQDALARF